MKKGDIIVRTVRNGQAAEGSMHKINYIAYDSCYYGVGWCISKKSCRLATPKEINYYNRGGKNINYMKKDLQMLEYQIF